MDEETSLLQMIRKGLNLRDCLDLVNIAYRDGNAVAPLASRIAPLVDRAAEEGNGQAIRILQQAARELSLVTLTVSRRLGLGRDTYMVGCIGSVFKSHTVLDDFKEILQREARTVEFRGPYVDYLPPTGSVVMAFRELKGRSSSETLFKAISKNLKDISQLAPN
jgi:N-acetylglucosamine kinase-like BadF-type ATPase